MIPEKTNEINRKRRNNFRQIKQQMNKQNEEQNQKNTQNSFITMTFGKKFYIICEEKNVIKKKKEN